MSIRHHYDKLRKWQIKISDQEAWTFGLMEIIVIVVIAGALLVTQKKVLIDGVYAGELIGIYNYILKFVT
ncbi:ABC transporter six-transmembrane domain-containing protein, partial [Acinetobacter baumannii]